MRHWSLSNSRNRVGMGVGIGGDSCFPPTLSWLELHRVIRTPRPLGKPRRPRQRGSSCLWSGGSLSTASRSFRVDSAQSATTSPGLPFGGFPALVCLDSFFFLALPGRVLALVGIPNRLVFVRQGLSSFSDFKAPHVP